MTEEAIGAPASSRALHCALKSGGVASPASGLTPGPHVARNSRTRASCSVSRTGRGSGIQRLSWNAPLLAARTSWVQARISSGVIRRTPQAPRPPALATAMERAGALAPAMGARRMGTRRPNRSQNALVRSRMLIADPSSSCGYRVLKADDPGCADDEHGGYGQRVLSATRRFLPKRLPSSVARGQRAPVSNSSFATAPTFIGINISSDQPGCRARMPSTLTFVEPGAIPNGPSCARIAAWNSMMYWRCASMTMTPPEGPCPGHTVQSAGMSRDKRSSCASAEGRSRGRRGGSASRLQPSVMRWDGCG